MICALCNHKNLSFVTLTKNYYEGKNLMKKNKRIIGICLTLALSLLLAPSVFSSSNDNVDCHYDTPFSASIPITRYTVEEAFIPFPGSDTVNENQIYTQTQYAPQLYNCFTYALIYYGNTTGLQFMPRTELFAINDPYYLLHSTSPCYEYVDFDDVMAGDIVIYRYSYNMSVNGSSNYVHAGIVSQKGSTLENTWIVSKWGEYEVYQHTINNCPYVGSGISLANNVPSEELYQIGISFARLTHSYCIDNTSATGSGVISNNIYHKVKCSGCGAFHFEEHNTNDGEPIIIKIGSLTTSTQHKVLCDCGYYHQRNEAHSYGSDGNCTKCGYAPITLNSIKEEEITQ